MLKIRFTDNRLPPFWAMEKQFTIGRSKSNHVTLDDDAVDDVHARIIQRGDTFLLKDISFGIYTLRHLDLCLRMTKLTGQ